MTKYHEIIRLAQPDLKLSQQKIAFSCGVAKKLLTKSLRVLARKMYHLPFTIKNEKLKRLIKHLSCVSIFPNILFIIFPHLVQFTHFSFCGRILLHMGILFFVHFFKFLKNLLGIRHFRVRFF